MRNPRVACHFFLNPPQPLASSFLHFANIKHSANPSFSSATLRHYPSPFDSEPRAHLILKRRTPCPLRARTRRALPALSPRRTMRQKASSAQVPSDSPSQAAEAPRTPFSEGGEATRPSLPVSQRRYKTRRPPTTSGATTSRPESSSRLSNVQWSQHRPLRATQIVEPDLSIQSYILIKRPCDSSLSSEIHTNYSRGASTWDAPRRRGVAFQPLSLTTFNIKEMSYFGRVVSYIRGLLLWPTPPDHGLLHPL
ncbi:hypothetical protein CK203_112737 [Vitis vinifera]|uniref:Uncharacterized protein n=1 Tax=Vitis vinifera TaxID=29760 RepID=A0A438FKA7_VITVI|nr:hypothetical protein CK203_112737 [Vitis vinifera]